MNAGGTVLSAAPGIYLNAVGGEEFENGKTYYALQGQPIRLPERSADRPDPSLLRWHNEHVFERGVAA